MIEIEKVKDDSETDDQTSFFIGLTDGRIFHTVVHHYWHSTGTIRGDGKADLDYKGFKVTTTQASPEVFRPPYEVTKNFPEPGGSEDIFRLLIANGLNEWDTYYTDRNPILN